METAPFTRRIEFNSPIGLMLSRYFALKQIVPQQNQQFSAAGINFGVVAEGR